MKRLLVLAAVLLVGLMLAHCGKEEATTESKYETLGRAFVRQLAEGSYDSITAGFDSNMARELPADKLEYIFGSLEAQFGAFKGQGGVRQSETGGFQMVFVTMQFEKSMLDAKVVFDSTDRVAGLFFMPTPPDAAYTSADYVDMTAFEQIEVTFGDTFWTLQGTINIPKGDGPFPAVVLVHGSGPQDRDETIGANKPFRDIAETLAGRGVVVLTYDKRTLTHKSKFAVWEHYTVKDEVIDDALRAAQLLQGTNKVDPHRIFVLGHSLGGMLIPRIAARGPSLAGFIIMAGLTRPLEDVYLEQLEYIYNLDGDLSEQEVANLTESQAQVGIVKMLKPNTQVTKGDMLLGVVPDYWIDLKDYSPAEAAKAINQPMLILQGERDYQVTMVDFENWKEALGDRDDVTFKSYPALNHIFIAGEGPSTPDEYFRQGHVDLEVIEDIAAWIKAH